MKKDLKIFTKNIEDEALAQIDLLLTQDAFKDSKVRIMPDVHAGTGCVIGFTGDLGNKVIPNIVGVDLGCGMYTANLGNIHLNLAKLDEVIRQYVPSGFNVHAGRMNKFPDIQSLKCYRNLKDTRRFERSLGTLGGGNHFIEVDIDEDDNKYLVVHTGSRNLGKQVADYYQNLADKIRNYGMDEYHTKAQAIITEYKAAGRRQEIQEVLKALMKEYLESKERIPKDLAYLEGTYRDDYLHDMQICQKFASENRKIIVDIICQQMNLKIIDNFETIHNYIDLKSNIVRKGAISAKKGEIILIPINMRDGCIIGKGKGNKDWNESAPHGAGRLMSRREAKSTFKLEDFKAAMQGIYTTSVNEGTIDEAPFVYKPIAEILDNIGDTVEILKIIKPIYNFKASDLKKEEAE